MNRRIAARIVIARGSAFIVNAGLLELKELLVAWLAVLDPRNLGDADDLSGATPQPLGLHDDVDRRRNLLLNRP